MDKTIQVRVYLWTDDKQGRTRKRRAYLHGTVYVPKNARHEIGPSKSVVFGDRRGLNELPGVIRRLLRQEGVTLVAV